MTVQDIKLWLREQSWMQPLRLANLKWRQRNGLYPDWPALLGADFDAWQTLRELALTDAKAPRVLLATSVGIHAASASFDSYLAVALTARGARCDVLLCDAALPACLGADYTWYPRPDHFAQRGSADDLCTACLEPARRLFGDDGLRLTIHRYGALLTSDDRARARTIATDTPLDAVADFTLDGMAIGEAALSGASRFFARGELETGSTQTAIVRRYLEAACLALFAMRRLLATEQYDVVVGHHGIYVPQGLVAAAAHEAGVRFVAWNPAYRTGCFIFSHGETYHRSMLDEPVATWENMTLSDAEQRKLMRYLDDRATGSQDWIAFHPADADVSEKPIGELGLDPAKPTVTLLTSVVWDAQLHYRQRAFKSQVEWVWQTIRHFIRREDVQLVIRAHPAEVTGSLPSREPIMARIAEAFPDLPPHIVIIKPEQRISTYALAEASDAVTIYATKTGIELAARGIPVIVAGESWLRGKDIGYDCDDAKAYDEMLQSLPFGRRLDAAREARAKLYAYHFFFRRMIQLPGFKRAEMPGIPFDIEPQGLAPFERGVNAALDCVCQGVLTGSPFVFDKTATASQHCVGRISGAVSAG
jgi:hypothetical protein